MTTWADEYVTMMDDCEKREERLTDWERGFVDRCAARSKRDAGPAQKQISALDSMMGSVPRRVDSDG